MNIKRALSSFSANLDALTFSGPVAYIYNPLQYARKPFCDYWDRFGAAPKEILFLGMNPGPWGMAQTGVPFGEVCSVRDWLKINQEVGAPPKLHPKRPIEGFNCKRSEASGKRLWGWARETFKTPEIFFDRFFVINYCPLLFYDIDGRNITPDKLKTAERERLCAECDSFLLSVIEHLKPCYAIGIGVFAEQRFRSVIPQGSSAIIGRITHPSPANPAANRGWSAVIMRELEAIGIRI